MGGARMHEHRTTDTWRHWGSSLCSSSPNASPDNGFVDRHGAPNKVEKVPVPNKRISSACNDLKLSAKLPAKLPHPPAPHHTSQS